MKQSMSYKQKIKWFWLVSIIVLFCCYVFAIKNTLVEYNQYKYNLAESINAMDLPGSLSSLKSRDQMLDQLFIKFRLDTLILDKNLLYVTSNYCKENSIKLKEYRPFSYTKKDGIGILTRIATVEGSFIPCLKLLYKIESEGKVGRITSTDFKSYIDPQDKKTKLNCTIFVQNLTDIKDENN
jgi:hypothetical protein